MLTHEDMKGLLVTAGVGIFGATTASQWRIVLNQEPEVKPGVSFARTITLSVTDTPVMSPKFNLDTDTLQVIVRGEAGNEREAQLKAIAVRDVLLGLPGQTIDTTKYVGVWHLNGPTKLGYDDGGRARYVLNFAVMRQPATLGNRTSL